MPRETVAPAGPPSAEGQSLPLLEPHTALRDRVYDALREAILEGKLVAGQRVKERHVAQQMRVSTTPVKDALRRLERDGLLVSNPYRGVVVSDAALTSIEEIVEIRSHLEGIAARFAAAKMSKEQLQELEHQVRLMESLSRPLDLEPLIEANTNFHRAIRVGGGNHFITSFVDVLQPFDRSIRRQALSDAEEAWRGYEEHAMICRLLARRDGESAEHLMRTHIMRVVKFVIDKSGRKQRPAVLAEA